MFRKTLFWIHLIAGLVAGIVIAVMSATGVALAFEKELVAWAEKDAQVVEIPSPTSVRIPADDLLKRFRAENPEARPSSITFNAKTDAAVIITVGRDETYYVNPYTAEIRQPASRKMRETLRTAESLHRWLALEGESRATGRALTGAANFAFFVLGVTGLYLWWPRNFSWRVLRPSLWFVGAKGKAREWNWHNVIGFWSLPILLVLTVSGVVMSYRWANNLVYQLAGETPPAIGGPGAPGAAGSNVQLAQPPAGSRPAGYLSHVAAIEQTLPRWQTMTFRLAANRRPEGAGAPSAGTVSEGNRPNRAETRGESRREGSQRSGNADTPKSNESRLAAPVTVLVRSDDSWPNFAATTLTLDPYTSSVLKTETFADATTGRRARMWLRFLHTGEAGGFLGKALAALASLGALFLVYTGAAMAVRRAVASATRRKADSKVPRTS